MAPLLITALIGLGAKLATDLLMAGAKEMFKGDSTNSTFASALDKARSASGATGPVPGAKALPADAALAERSRLLAAEPSALPATGFAQGTDSYRRLSEIQAI